MVRENRKLHLQICNDPLRIHQGIQWVSTYASSQHAGVRFKNPYFSPINLKTAIIPSTKSTICASHIVMMFFSELVLFLSIARSYFVNRIMKSAKNPCGSKCLWTSCFNKSIQHISASLGQLYCWLTYSVTFKCVEMFSLDTKVLHTPWQWLTGGCCGHHKTRVSWRKKEAEKCKCSQRFLFFAVQTAPPHCPSPLYCTSTTYTLQERPAQALPSCTPTKCQSFYTVHWGSCCPNTSAIASSQWWTHRSNSRTEPRQGKFDQLLSGLPLLHFSSAVNCNLSLDLLHLLRAVLMPFPLTCSVQGHVSPHHPSQRYCRDFSPHSNVDVGVYFKHTVTNLTFGILLDSES